MDIIVNLILDNLLPIFVLLTILHRAKYIVSMYKTTVIQFSHNAPFNALLLSGTQCDNFVALIKINLHIMSKKTNISTIFDTKCINSHNVLNKETLRVFSVLAIRGDLV